MTQTAQDGSFHFPLDELGELPYGSALTAQHPEHCPGGIDLPSAPDAWPKGIVIRLEPVEPIEVLVVDSNGHGQAAAVVHHEGVPRLPDGEAPLLSRHEHFLSQEATTDASGRARLAPFPGEQALWAESGAFVSTPWQGLLPSHVTLSLKDSFTVGGTLALDDWKAWDADYQGERRILIAGEEGNLWRPLARLRDVSEGSWGPIRVPLGKATRYSVRLEGIPIVPIEERFEPPEAGSHLRFDFVAGRQADCNMMVVDEAEQPITNARAIAWWEANDPPTTWRRVEGASRPDGRIYLGSFPAGQVRYQVSAPGFSSEEGLIDSGDALLITLAKGGRISGIARHDGSPVSDFQVIFWNGGQRRSQFFFGHQDGRFVLDGLRPGDWSLQATSAKLPLGRPETVKVSAGSEARVELDLPIAMLGVGRVIDEETGEPVPFAKVQPYSTGGVDRFFPWGPPAVTAQDGTFELEAFVGGVNFISVTAEGYARTDSKKNARVDEPFDWGDVLLPRPAPLEVTLIGLDELQRFSPIDLRGLTLEDSLVPLPQRRFSAKGVLRYEDVAPGDLRLYLSEPGGDWSRLDLHLERGASWRYDFKIAGERRLKVHALEANGEPVAEETPILLGALEENGPYVLRHTLASSEGTALFEGIRASEAEVIVLAPNGDEAASQGIHLGAESSLEVTIRLGAPNLSLRVVDGEGVPIAGVSVRVRSLDGNAIHSVGRTDADGWASLAGVPRSSVLLDLLHGIAGTRQGIPFDATIDRQEFVLEATGRIDLRVVDGMEPLAGVAVSLRSESGVLLSSTKETDADGFTRFEPIGEGTYLFGCSQPDAWPSNLVINVAEDERVERRVQMRRLADLELTLRRADGIPIGGTDVFLRSLEFGLDVAEWLAAGRVTASGGLRTDGLGVLRVEGLPRGSYEWAVAGEATASGSFELLPAQRNRVEARLPAR